MGIVDGTGLTVWEGGLFEPAGVLLPRVRWAFNAIRNIGGGMTLNEAGRPYGVESDKYARNPADTLSGRSTVWFQWGRYLRGETPSAANPANGPYASEHTQGIAIDCNAAQPSLRAHFFALVGLENTISSESWHWAIRGPSQVDTTVAALDIKELKEAIVAISNVGAIEDKDTKGIAIFGDVKNGWVEIAPQERDRYNALKSVLDTISVEAGGEKVLPDVPLTVDAVGWENTKYFYKQN